MPAKILMPALSPTMTEGTLLKWHKKEGDLLKSGDLMAEIETDKATMEVEVVDEGILGKIVIPEGTENVKVNSLIGIILEEDEDHTIIETLLTAQTETASVMEPQTPSASDSSSALSETFSLNEMSSQTRILASPLARKIARQKKIDLSILSGSGPGGRIVKKDLESLPQKSTTSTHLRSAPPKDVPLSSMRKTIAKRLLESKQNVPHFYLTIFFCLDELLTMRKSLNENRVDTKLTINDFVIKACALALRDVPEANASWMENSIRFYSTSDISVAVALDDGLITPIIKNAEQKTIFEISSEMKSLAHRAKEGKLKPEEFQGGSFSISNLGMYGIQQFSAIINPPQAGILAVGAGEKKPTVTKEGTLGISTQMSGTLSIDHRVIDGKAGAMLMASIKKYLENPFLMLV